MMTVSMARWMYGRTTTKSMGSCRRRKPVDEDFNSGASVKPVSGSVGGSLSTCGIPGSAW